MELSRIILAIAVYLGKPYRQSPVCLLTDSVQSSASSVLASSATTPDPPCLTERLLRLISESSQLCSVNCKLRTDRSSPVIFKALTSNGPVVVDFFATWCGPCKAVAPVVGKLSETYTNVRFIQVDVDKVRSVAQELEVRAMPTFVLYKDGQLQEKRVVGGNMKELEAAIKEITA